VVGHLADTLEEHLVGMQVEVNQDLQVDTHLQEVQVVQDMLEELLVVTLVEVILLQEVTLQGHSTDQKEVLDLEALIDQELQEKVISEYQEDHQT
jgi:hypothetical protein